MSAIALMLEKETILVKNSNTKNVMTGNANVMIQLFVTNNVMPKKKPYVVATAFPPLNCAKHGKQ